MRKSENLCNIGENKTIDSSSKSSSVSVSTTNKKNINRNNTTTTSRITRLELESSEINQEKQLLDDSNRREAEEEEEASINDNDSDELDLALAHELARALRCQDTERFIEIYDFNIPSHFDRNRVSELLISIHFHVFFIYFFMSCLQKNTCLFLNTTKRCKLIRILRRQMIN